jgi:hypothetical protein
MSGRTLSELFTEVHRILADRRAHPASSPLRQEAFAAVMDDMGHQLFLVQCGLDPDDWKPMSTTIGNGNAVATSDRAMALKFPISGEMHDLALAQPAPRHSDGRARTSRRRHAGSMASHSAPRRAIFASVSIGSPASSLCEVLAPCVSIGPWVGPGNGADATGRPWTSANEETTKKQGKDVSERTLSNVCER